MTIGQNAEGAGVTECLIGGILALIPLVNLIFAFMVRGAIRDKYNLEVTYFLVICLFVLGYSECFVILTCLIMSKTREHQGYGVILLP